MNGESSYLEKYSVASAPSRDYYGIRIYRDQVKLFRWKISHGPHRTPIVQSISFADFEKDRSLHEEILRVFGTSVLQYIRDTIAGETKNSEKNLCGLTKGWNRVFTEGILMQQAGKSAAQSEKKPHIRAKGRVSPTKVKSSAPSNVRQKNVSKTPLEVIKKITVPKKPIEGSKDRPVTASTPAKETSARGRRVTEVSEKMLRLKVTKIIEESKTKREAQQRNVTTMTVGSAIDNTKKNAKLTPKPSKSTLKM